MSLSNPKMVNPSKKFIQYKGDSGTFQYWDKEKGENVEMKKPMYFVVLDELSTVSGYSEKYSSGIVSNEVHSITDEILKVRSFKGGFTAVGKYKDIKDAIVAVGGKFTKSVYAMLITGKGEQEIVHFEFSGSSFQGWLEKSFNTQEFGVVVKTTKEAKKGKIVYFVPMFERFNLTKEILEVATNIDKELQVYLKAYKAGQLENIADIETAESQVQHSEATQETAVQTIPESTEASDLPFK